MGIVRPHLWYTDNAYEAAQFYVSVIPNSEITAVHHAPGGTPDVPEGTPFIVSFTLDGMAVDAISGGDSLKLTDAFSFVLDCADQAEVDHYWETLLADGGRETQCGWLVDRFGLSWQVVPKDIEKFMTGSDPAGAARAMEAMLGMKKLDLAALEAAYRGD